MKNQFLCFVVLLLILFSVHLVSQENNTKPIPEMFQSPISPKEKRILDWKESIKSFEEIPNQWNLFFKERNGNDLVFYDWNGNEINFQYRRNKWDFEAEEKVVFIQPGRAYRVQGSFTGAWIFKEEKRNLPIPPRKIFSPVSNWKPKNKMELEEAKAKPSIWTFRYESASELNHEEVIY